MLITIIRLIAAMVFLAGFALCSASDTAFLGTPSTITFDRMLPAAGAKLIAQAIVSTTTDVRMAPSHVQIPQSTLEQETLVVKSGDTLIGLFGTRQYRAVANFNKIANPDRIFVGQTIVLPPGVTVITHAKQHAVRTQQVSAIATPAHPEFVETKFGTAWVYPGTNRVRVDEKDLELRDPEFSTAALFVMALWTTNRNISEEASRALVRVIALNEYAVVELAVGDRYEAMLFADNDVRWNVLAAWSEKRMYHGLCYGVRVRNMDHLMIRELASGNWIFHSLPTTGTEENIACERLRRSP